MPFINPAHAYGMMVAKEDSPTRQNFDTQLQIVANFVFTEALKFISPSKKQIDYEFTKMQLVQYYNTTYHLIFDQFVKQNKHNPQPLSPFSNPFQILKSTISPPSSSSRNIYTDTETKYEMICFTDGNKIEKQDFLKTRIETKAEDLSARIISLSEYFAFYKNDGSKFCIIVLKHTLSSYQVFLLKCIQFAYAACGYYFVIITNFMDNSISDLLSTGYVVELHIFNYNIPKRSYEKINQDIIFNDDLLNYNSDIFCYTSQIQNDSLIQTLSKEIQSIVQIIPFSSNLSNVFKHVHTYIETSNNRISKSSQPNMVLCPNIPMYKKRDDDVSYKQSHNNLFSIDACSYHLYLNGKIRIGSYYTNYDHLHQMNISFYLSNQLYTAKVSDTIVDNVVHIIENIKTTKRWKPKILINGIKSKMSKKNISSDLDGCLHLAMSYLMQLVPTHFTDSVNKSPIKLRDTQVLAIYYAVYTIVQKIKILKTLKKEGKSAKKLENTTRGTIFQIDTGEGKTFVILFTALFFALQGYKVHIITHSITLAVRDFHFSYSFLKMMGVKSGLLMHVNEKKQMKEKYQSYFKDEVFKDPLEINSDILENAQIIYSTPFNFEAAFLTFTEHNPSKNPLDRTICLIDEADSMLLDDIYNGTTISKPVKSDIEKVIAEIYDMAEATKEMNMTDRKRTILTKLSSRYPIATHADIGRLIEEADYVREHMRQNFHYFIQKKQSFAKPSKKTLQIVPYDFKKGVLEDNKQFDGHIQQFIAAKENKRIKREAVSNGTPIDKVKLIEMEPISINYLYIAHPVYLQKYLAIVGYTGTLGSKDDIRIYNAVYHLDALKIPRFTPNFRFDLQPILVDNNLQRNRIIAQKIKALSKLNESSTSSKHRRSVLIILEDPNEIPFLANRLNSEGMASYCDLKVKTNIPEIDSKFPHSKDLSKSIDVIIAANNFSRGTNADQKVRYPKHLHVFIGFYSRNIRSVLQALGRTGRSGRPGTTQIICLKKQYYASSDDLDADETVENTIDNFYNTIQDGRSRIIVELGKRGFEWIFDESTIKKESIDRVLNDKFYQQIRRYTGNVSRQSAVNYVYPFGFNTADYFIVQAQRIFSLINCPNCKFTWRLISRYFREMVLQGWSLFIDDPKAPKCPLEDKITQFFSILDKYILPPKFGQQSIVSSFLNVTKVAQEQISTYLKAKKNDLTKLYWALGGEKNLFLSIKLGAFPFTSIKQEESASGIKFEPVSYIIDPEIIYEGFSITKYLDWIFDKIYDLLNCLLGAKTCLQLYLKRTIAGTEFGICFQPFIQGEGDRIPLTLHDIDLTLIAAINCKSERVLLVSILLLLAAVLAVCFSMLEVILIKFFKQSFKEIVKQLLSTVINYAASKLISTVVDKICEFLILMIQKLMKNRFEGSWIQLMLKIFVTVDVELMQNSKTLFDPKDELKQCTFRLCACVVLLIAAFFTTFQKTPELPNETERKDFCTTECGISNTVDKMKEDTKKMDAVIADDGKLKTSNARTFTSNQEDKYKSLANNEFNCMDVSEFERILESNHPLSDYVEGKVTVSTSY